MPLKILYTNFHAGSGIGGHSVYILTLAAALAGRHKITIAAPATSGLCRHAANIAGVHVVAQSYPNRLQKIWAAARQMRELIVQHGFDIIHVNGSSDHRLAILATRWLGKKKPRIVFTKHNDKHISGFSSAVRAAIGTDHVIGVCDFVRKRLSASAYGRGALSTIANGVDLNRFKPKDSTNLTTTRHRWITRSLPSDAVVFGSNAGTADYKGWLDLATAVASLPLEQRRRVYILLAGSVPDQSQLRQLEQLGVSKQVGFVGDLDDVRPFIEALDVGFVLSYRVETISFACREMMAMGRPVLVSDHGGLPENITDGVDGWVVHERDIAAIRARVCAILQSPGQLHAMGISARAKSVREFSVERFVSQTERVYERVAGGT